MSRKIISYAVTLAMVFSVFCFPTFGYGTDTVTAEETQPAAKSEIPQVTNPTGVKAKAISSKTIRITWKKVVGASGYEVYRYSAKKKKYCKIKTTGANSVKSTKLKANTVYRYKVRAYVSQNDSKYYSAFSKTVKTRTKKSDAQKVVAKAKTKIGANYRAGGAGPKSFDCNGFVYWVYKNSDVKTKKKIKRTSSAGLHESLKKYKVASSIKGIKKAKPGDIILFKRGGRYSHAAIYSGNGKIIHAANARRGVVSQSVKQLHNSGTRVADVIRVIK